MRIDYLRDFTLHGKHICMDEYMVSLCDLGVWKGMESGVWQDVTIPPQE